MISNEDLAGITLNNRIIGFAILALLIVQMIVITLVFVRVLRVRRDDMKRWALDREEAKAMREEIGQNLALTKGYAMIAADVSGKAKDKADIQSDKVDQHLTSVEQKVDTIPAAVVCEIHKQDSSMAMIVPLSKTSKELQ